MVWSEVSCRILPLVQGFSCEVEMKVYGWQSFWNDPRIKGTHKQVRLICAARSMAEIMRTFKLRKCEMFNICETGNQKEIEVATAEPLVIFATSLSVYGEPYYEYRRPSAVPA